MPNERPKPNESASGQEPNPWDDFDGLQNYYSFRPEYPLRIAEHIRATFSGTVVDSVVEVGAGTGLFTQSLATTFGPDCKVLALEPNEDMRQHAKLVTPVSLGINYIDGVAEVIPVPDRSTQLLAAASAIHRFRRPEFYAEAQRVLISNGVLALVQYEPYDKESSFADGFLSLIEKALPQYQRHRHSRPEGGYSEVDIVDELRGLKAFRNVERTAFVFREKINLEHFHQRALSFTIVQKAIEHAKEGAIMASLADLFYQHEDSGGLVEMPYEAEIIVAHRV